MKNIFLVLKREYLSRVTKKSFIVMTILGPVLIGAMYALIGWAAVSSISNKKIEVLDESGLFKGKFQNSKDISYTYIDGSIDEAKKNFKKSGFDALAYIPADILDNPKNVKIFSEKGVSLELQSGVERTIEREIEKIKLTEAGITQKVLEDAKMNISTETISLSEEGEKSSSAGAATAIGFFLAFLIYMSVFIYGAQVMRGVMEEKMNRIVEVIISSVKPFELMMGKIMGVALVGLTQFLLWIVLTFAVTTATTTFIGDKFSSTALSEEQMKNMPPEVKEQMKEQMKNQMPMAGGVGKVMKALKTLPYATIIICFIIYFLGGYLLYSALFGAIGSAVDNETDTQQFMLPITIPIIASFIFAQFVMRDPDGGLAFWTSMIPFTSPIIMMVRIPFGVPVWQIILSVSLLIGGFVFTTWLAARIYRVGILMYGKKVTWKEISKWIFYKG